MFSGCTSLIAVPDISKLDTSSVSDMSEKFYNCGRLMSLPDDISKISTNSLNYLNDIFSKTIRPIKHKYNTKEIYDKKTMSWNERFDNLNIIEW